MQMAVMIPELMKISSNFFGSNFFGMPQSTPVHPRFDHGVFPPWRVRFHPNRGHNANSWIEIDDALKQLVFWRIAVLSGFLILILILIRVRIHEEQRKGLRESTQD